MNSDTAMRKCAVRLVEKRSVGCVMEVDIKLVGKLQTFSDIYKRDRSIGNILFGRI